MELNKELTKDIKSMFGANVILAIYTSKDCQISHDINGLNFDGSIYIQLMNGNIIELSGSEWIWLKRVE